MLRKDAMCGYCFVKTIIRPRLMYCIHMFGRIRKTRVLVIGVEGMAVEVCKNIVLAGIKSLTLLDSNTIKHEHLGAQFFLLPSDIGINVSHSEIQRHLGMQVI